MGTLATPLEYHVPKLPGLGDVDWGRFFSVLGDVGYAGPICVEVEDRAFEGSLESRQVEVAKNEQDEDQGPHDCRHDGVAGRRLAPPRAAA